MEENPNPRRILPSKTMIADAPAEQNGHEDFYTRSGSITKSKSMPDFSATEADSLLNEYDNLQYSFENLSIFDLADSSFGQKLFRISERFERAKNFAKNKYLSLKQKKEEPKFVKLTDKVAFVSGVAILIITSYLMGQHPWLVAPWYTALSLILLPIRFIVFRQQLWHYFMFDFCYFANFLLLCFINFFPTSRLLFLVCFSFSMGPVAWAVIVWRISLVFHSLEKVTTVVIHVMPFIVCLVIRFKETEPIFEVYRTMEASFIELSFLPLVPYLAWQTLYYIKTEVISAQKIRDKNYMTSYRWLSGEGSQLAFFKRWLQKYPTKGVFIFMGMQLIFQIITSLPVKLLFEFHHLALFYSFVVILWSVWNGASFYFEVFSRDYLKKLKALDELRSAAENRKTHAS